MIQSLDDTLGKSCLIGLSYFDLQGELLKQNLLAAVVKSVDHEAGITLSLIKRSEADNDNAEFILPSNLSCWFSAPEGEYHTSVEGVKVRNPNYLVTWDIYQTKDTAADGEQQWWEWVPRTAAPNVGT